MIPKDYSQLNRYMECRGEGELIRETTEKAVVNVERYYYRDSFCW